MTTEGTKILIVEDDPVIAGEVSASLTRWGYATQIARDFEHIDSEFTAARPGLVLMDVTLPYFNGYYWCAEIRKISRVPIVFLSSRADAMDIVMGMQLGGDDYVTKPFSMEVLTAKITAVLRRSYPSSAPRGTLGRAELFENEGTLKMDGRTLPLTRNEQRILTLLVEKKNQPVSREALILRLWDSDSFIDDNTLTVNMNRLRKRLAEFGLDRCIETRKGQGYLLREPQRFKQTPDRDE